MGVDTVVRLPANVRVSDVADVIAIVSGKPVAKISLGSGVDSWAAEVAGVRVSGLPTMPQCAYIHIDGPLPEHIQNYRDGQDGLRVLYHFETENGERLLMRRSTAFWIAVGRRLVQFFGGTQDYQDCDARDVNYRKPPKSDRDNNPSDGKPWSDFQQRKLALKPLTLAELKSADKLAAYQRREAGVNHGVAS